MSFQYMYIYIFMGVVTGYTGQNGDIITNKWTPIGEPIKNGWLVQNGIVTSWIVILLNILYCLV